MPFWHRQTEEEKLRQEAERQAEVDARAAEQQEMAIQQRSLEALRAGGLPIRAQERVAALRSTAGAPPAYSSDLSVNELLLMRQIGYQPLGLVSGSSVYHIGWNRWNYTGELEAQTRALHEAANLAIDRARQEAQNMGAIGVIGVEVQITKPGWGEHLVEVLVLGTAISVLGAPPAEQPFLSGLSAQEYAALLRVGARPAGLVFGNCAYYIYTDWRTVRQNLSWFNQEVQKYSVGLHEAQSAAFSRLRAHAQQVHGHGVVGVHIEHTLRRIPYTDSNGNEEEEREDYVIDYLSWGTAIVEAPTEMQMERPSVVLDLEDRSTVGMPALAAQEGE